MFKKGLQIFAIFLCLFSLSEAFIPHASAEAYPCQNYSGHNECIDLQLTPSCNGTTPVMTWHWTQKFGNTQFSIVYSRGGSWYILRVGNVTSVSMPPSFGGPGSGGSDGGPLHPGEIISGKISGGSAPNITTGYTNPDQTKQVLDCSTPTATPTSAAPTATPTSAAPTATTVPTDIATVAIKLSSIDSADAAAIRIPRHATKRKVTLYFYKTNAWKTDPTGSNADYHPTDNVFFVSTPPESYGSFVNQNFHIGIIPTGKYYVFAKTEGSLRESLTEDSSMVTVDESTPGAILFDFTSTNRSLVMGDLNNDNQIDAQDWSNFTTCYDYPNDPSKKDDCKKLDVMFDDSFVNTPIADLNDDGFIDGIDFNNFLITYKQYSGL